ncbi:ABC transporter substrate-binding protein [Virgibacillus halodenitrificans]|uniref:ABC transporter substrate-binding protein n=1 Tax=Virgibacillus halodenitrificans TaxID=1482 RepID=UPI0024BFB89D|nr:ABC transporter substrate-binding protein [Virgibacillus halodenitrificans]WHX26297.1 ABC transporter substrate-binding protein [Virgibacillus halodenitrificans]
MKINKLFVSISLLLMLIVTLTACSNNSGNGSENANAEAPGEPQEGGKVVGAMGTAPGGVFNPIFYTDSYEEKMLEFTHESLVTQNDKLEFTPQLAEEWTISEDQTEVTFNIRKDVKWHDGEDFTADDVVFTYQTLMDPSYVASGGLRTIFVEPLKGYESYSKGETDKFEAVVAEDEYTVTFKFDQPNASLLYYTSFPIIPKHIFADMPIADIIKAPESRDPEKVVGTGPFKFSSMVERESYEMVRHDDYWQGKPYLEKVEWKIVEPSVMIGLLEKGDIDFIAQPDNIPAADFEQVAGNENIKTIKQPDFSIDVLGFKLNHRTAKDVQNKAINPDNWKVNEKIANPKVRQAIAYAINREGIVKGLLFGQGEVVESPIPRKFWAYDDEAVNHYDFDQEQAKSILDEEGYVDTDGDGMREDPDGNKWILNLNYPAGKDRQGPIIEQQLEEVGISVDLRQPKEFSAFLEDIENDNNDWDLYLIGWGLNRRDPDPSEIYSIKTPYNYARWNNKEADKLLKDATEGADAFEQSKRKEIYAEWQEIFSRDLPELILYEEQALWGYNNRLHGIDPLPFTMYNNTHEWWVSK